MKILPKVLKVYIPYGSENRQWPQVFSILVASLGSFMFGALFAWTSPAIPILTSEDSPIGKITMEEASYFAVIPPISLAITAPFLIFTLDLVGRKRTIMFMTIPQFLSWMLIAFADNLYLVYVSRFLTGIGDAIYFCALPVYIGEIAEPYVRGSWGNLLTITTYFGYFMINVVGAYCNIKTTALIFSCVPVIHFILLMFLPESPYYCLMNEEVKQAKIALQTLRWSENVDEELLQLTKDVQRQLSEPRTFKSIYANSTNRKALIVCTVMRAIQQFSGLSAFAAYTQYMFEQAGGHLPASTASIIYNAVLTITISCFSFVVDKFGRKPLMIFSSLGCGAVLSLEATYFFVDQNSIVDTSGFMWLPLAGMLLYLILSSSGLAILPTLMMGELFSASIKARALCIANICFGIYVLSSSKLFQFLTEKFGMHLPFYVFAACCFLGSIFSYFYVPETKGKTLEEIQNILQGKTKDKETLVSKC